MKEVITIDNFEDYIFYNIEVNDLGEKIVHICLDYYEYGFDDEGNNEYGVDEYVDLDMPLEDFVKNYGGEKWVSIDLLGGDYKKNIYHITEEDFLADLKRINGEIERGEIKFLDFRDITEDTDPGHYFGGYNYIRDENYDYDEDDNFKGYSDKLIPAADIVEDCVDWLKNIFSNETIYFTSDSTRAIIGINGSLGSSVVASLLVRALGKERVIGVLMPCGNQENIQDAKDIIELLGITCMNVDIQEAYEGLNKAIMSNLDSSTHQQLDNYKTNTPARLRMTALYGISAILGDCRVANTTNFSELSVGYTTLFGDSVGDFAPLAKLDTEYVARLGKELGLPKRIIEKEPWDGMSYKSNGEILGDEEKLGVSYHDINLYLLHNRRGLSVETREKVIKLINKNHFKKSVLSNILCYDPPYYIDEYE